MREILNTLGNGADLTKDQAKTVFTQLVNGELEDVQIAALLMGLRTKKESIEEISGAAEALRASALNFESPNYEYADSCGTGGDGAHTINVSTGAAILNAALGMPMAKHGNRSISSKCGSADLLESLGVKLDIAPSVARKCLDEANICFLFAPKYHSGLRHAGPVRKSLGIRTVMNILGPLVNPAAPAYQVLGVFDKALCAPMARVLGELGTKRALVVHGSGLDEIAIHDATTCVLLQNNKIEELIITPEQAGLKRFALDAIKGGTPDENTEIMTRILQGNGTDAQNAAIAMNTAAMLILFDKAREMDDATSMALDALKSGKCVPVLDKLVEISNGA